MKKKFIAWLFMLPLFAFLAIGLYVSDPNIWETIQNGFYAVINWPARYYHLCGFFGVFTLVWLSFWHGLFTLTDFAK